MCVHGRRKYRCIECNGGVPRTSSKTQQTKTKAPRVWKKCPHDKIKSVCRDCGGVGICIHGRRKTQCKECGGGGLCPHNTQKSKCKICGGVGICPHDRIKSVCIQCKGASVCVHDRIKSTCTICRGSAFCIHSRIKYECKQCGGSTICHHNRKRYLCKDCSGKGLCQHNKRKSRCPQCQGSQICEHGRDKSRCRQCNGNLICCHSRLKYDCKLCHGSLICTHGRRKYTCKACLGTQICPHSRIKYDCIQCEGSNTCKIHGCIQRLCRICAEHTTCTEPCGNTGNLTIQCPFGCNKFYLCLDCKKAQVGYIGNKCAACEKGKTRREIFFEKYLREQADAGVIPLYTSWNCIDKERDVDQCSKAYRPDFTYICEKKGLVVIVEFDERQHDSYEESCELNRMLMLNHSFMTNRAACIRWIRYNPDGFNVNGRKIRVSAKDRKAFFIERLRRALDNTDYSQKIEIEYLFYNKTPEIDQGDPFNHTECFKDILDYHQCTTTPRGNNRKG